MDGACAFYFEPIVRNILVSDKGFEYCIRYHPGTENYKKPDCSIPEKTLTGRDKTGLGTAQKDHQATYQIKKYRNRRHDGEKNKIQNPASKGEYVAGGAPPHFFRSSA